MYLINELQGWAYAIWHIGTYPYINFMISWWPFKVCTVIVSFIIVSYLIIAVEHAIKDWKRYGIERFIVFAGRNAGILAKEKRSQILYANPLRIFSKFWPEISHSKETSETIILFLLFFALMSKYLWFILTFKILLLVFVLFVVIYVQIHGYVSLGINLIIITLCNLAYLSNFSIGFVDLTPHYTIHFWSWLHIHPVVVNPTDQDINLNKYIYALLLFSCYVSVLRYIGNHFYWKRAKHQPAPWARDFVGEPLDGEQDAIDALTLPDANTTPVEDKPLSAKEKRRKAQAKQIIRGTNITGEQACELYFLASQFIFEYQNEHGYSRVETEKLTNLLKEKFADLPYSFKISRQMKMRRFYLQYRNRPCNRHLLSSNKTTIDNAVTSKPYQDQDNTDIEPSNNDDINSYLKLLGFSMSAITVMVTEYGNEHIAKVLDRLKQATGHSNPKVEFLKLLEQGDNVTNS